MHIKYCTPWLFASLAWILPVYWLVFFAPHLTPHARIVETPVTRSTTPEFFGEAQVPPPATESEPDTRRDFDASPEGMNRFPICDDAARNAAYSPTDIPQDLKSRTRQLSDQLTLLAKGGLIRAEEQVELGDFMALSPDRALEWVAMAKSESEQAARLTACLALWSQVDFESAWSWARKQDDLIPALTVLSSSSDGVSAAALAADWVQEAPDTSLERFAYLTQVLRDTGQNEANVVFADSLAPEYRNIALESALTELAAAHPEKALAYAQLKTDRQEQQTTLQGVVTGWPSARLGELLRSLSAADSPEALAYATQRMKSVQGP